MFQSCEPVVLPLTYSGTKFSPFLSVRQAYQLFRSVISLLPSLSAVIVVSPSPLMRELAFSMVRRNVRVVLELVLFPRGRHFRIVGVHLFAAFPLFWCRFR